MSIALKVSRALSLGGKQFNGSDAVSDDMSIVRETSVLKAQPATLTTRTGNTVGTLTMTNSGHGITTAQIIDLYWNGGYQAGVLVGTVSGTSVPFTAGVGTNLPIATTLINVGIVGIENFACNGTNVQALAMAIDDSTTESIWSFMSSVPAVIWTRHISQGQGGDVWTALAAWANPITGAAPATVRLSHADVDVAHNLRTGCVTH